MTTCYVGCRHEPARVVVSGTVTYQGQPVHRGEIRFIPTKGSTGPVCTADIVAGKYQAGFRGGVIVGTARVELFAFRADSPSAGHPTAEEIVGGSLIAERLGEQYLPAKYNTQSELETTIPRQRDVCRDFAIGP